MSCISNRYKVILEYIGAGYCGWQRQENQLSLQQVVEEAIYAFSKEHAATVVAGRTDAGVNAYGQVIHFDLVQNILPDKLMHSINHFCRNHTVGAVYAESVSNDFHARFSAKSRHYVYKILNRKSINIIKDGVVHWVRHDLNVKNMQSAANYLLGNHDFSSFRAGACQSKSPIKTIDKIEIIKNDDNIEIYISARSFLHHMVRNIVGSLIMVGKGDWQIERMKLALLAKDRRAGGPIAPAQGLYFLKVDY